MSYPAVKAFWIENKLRLSYFFCLALFGILLQIIGFALQNWIADAHVKNVLLAATGFILFIFYGVSKG